MAIVFAVMSIIAAMSAKAPMISTPGGICGNAFCFLTGVGSAAVLVLRGLALIVGILF